MASSLAEGPCRSLMILLLSRYITLRLPLAVAGTLHLAIVFGWLKSSRWRLRNVFMAHRKPSHCCYALAPSARFRASKPNTSNATRPHRSEREQCERF